MLVAGCWLAGLTGWLADWLAAGLAGLAGLAGVAGLVRFGLVGWKFGMVAWLAPRIRAWGKSIQNTKTMRHGRCTRI